MQPGHDEFCMCNSCYNTDTIAVLEPEPWVIPLLPPKQLFTLEELEANETARQQKNQPKPRQTVTELISKLRIKDNLRLTDTTEDSAIFTCDCGNVKTYYEDALIMLVNLRRWLKCNKLTCNGKRKKQKINCQSITDFNIEPEPHPSFTYVYEKQCLDVITMIFQVPFIKARPVWLHNIFTNHKLELDFYNHQYRVAFEYQELHHYQPITDSKYDYKSVRRNDKIKAMICIEAGVTLFQIPHCRDYGLLIDVIIGVTEGKLPIELEYALNQFKHMRSVIY